MADWVGQVKLLAAGVLGAMLLAGVGLQLSVTPSYPLITRPTPTPTPAPYTWNDPRVTSRTVTLAQAQANATFRILRPTLLGNADPASVTVHEAEHRVLGVQQTYLYTPTRGVAPVSIWIRQSPLSDFYNRGFFTQNVTGTVTLEMSGGRQQPATVTRSQFGTSLSWTDQQGSFTISARGADLPVEHLAQIATSLR